MPLVLVDVKEVRSQTGLNAMHSLRGSTGGNFCVDLGALMPRRLAHVNNDVGIEGTDPWGDAIPQQTCQYQFRANHCLVVWHILTEMFMLTLVTVAIRAPCAWLLFPNSALVGRCASTI